MSVKHARLRWLCRRGMKELDVVLSRYLSDQYPTADSSQQQAFERLLEMQDPNIYAMLLGRETCDDPEISKVLEAVSTRHT